MQNLDFSGLPRYEDIRDLRSYEDIRPTLFDIDVEEILKDIDLTDMDMPSIAPTIPQVPIVPQPIQPMNFTRLSNLPVSNFAQPNIREIIDPIKVGRAKPIQLPQPGLFSLV
jgi:hypothetical protein